MKLRKLMFVLPNLFTVTSIFCGFYALTRIVGDAAPSQLYQASIAIFFAMFFDGFDGRVARLTQTQSQFGVELDSLADVMSFGLVPAILVYRWALEPLGLLGLLVAFSFACCGALRLARFNVLAQNSHHGGGGAFFVGLPIPLAAGMIVSMVIAHHGVSGGELAPTAQAPIALVVVLLALMMVSTVRYRTLKDLRLSPKSGAAFAALCLLGVLVATQLHPAYVLVVLFSTYLTLGLIESALLVARRAMARRASAGEVEVDDQEADDLDEQDFL
ncbi:MAG: CDP-diacylglycerol--serine O-phosphatidyltransferase [Myxococcaceae bacterium]